MQRQNWITLIESSLDEDTIRYVSPFHFVAYGKVQLHLLTPGGRLLLYACNRNGSISLGLPDECNTNKSKKREGDKKGVRRNYL